MLVIHFSLLDWCELDPVCAAKQYSSISSFYWKTQFCQKDYDYCCQKWMENFSKVCQLKIVKIQLKTDINKKK